MRLFDLSIVGMTFCSLVGMGLLGASRVECKPKLEIGMTYSEAKVACPDLAKAPYDRDENTSQVFFMCPSQHTYIVGDLKTTRMVGFLLTPERQTELRIEAGKNQDSVIAAFHRDTTK